MPVLWASSPSFHQCGRRWLHSPLARLLLRVPSPSSVLRPFGWRLPTWVSALTRHHEQRPFTRRHPKSPLRPSARSQRLRFSPLFACEPIPSRNRAQGPHRPGAYPPSAVAPTLRVRSPSSPFVLTPLTRKRAAIASGSDLEVSLPQGAPQGRGFSPPPASLPSSGSGSSRCSWSSVPSFEGTHACVVTQLASGDESLRGFSARL